MKIVTDEGVMNIEFEPSEHDTAESAAKALHAALVPLVKAFGQTPEIELAIHNPEETPEYLEGGYKQWWVVWEAGPHDWGIDASMEIRNKKWFTEPYYGFDLLFVED